MTLEDQLLSSEEPAVRYLTRVLALGDDAESRAARRDRAAIRKSKIVRSLLSEVGPDRQIAMDPYSK